MQARPAPMPWHHLPTLLDNAPRTFADPVITAAMSSSSSPHPDSMQARLSHVQALYREWTALLPRLQAAQDEWLRSAGLMRELMDFYFNGEFTAMNQAVDAGAALDLRTPGEHSVLSEDALWNALYDHQALAWGYLRSAVKALDRER